MLYRIYQLLDSPQTVQEVMEFDNTLLFEASRAEAFILMFESYMTNVRNYKPSELLTLGDEFKDDEPFLLVYTLYLIAKMRLTTADAIYDTVPIVFKHFEDIRHKKFKYTSPNLIEFEDHSSIATESVVDAHITIKELIAVFWEGAQVTKDKSILIPNALGSRFNVKIDVANKNIHITTRPLKGGNTILLTNTLAEYLKSIDIGVT